MVQFFPLLFMNFKVSCTQLKYRLIPFCMKFLKCCCVFSAFHPQPKSGGKVIALMHTARCTTYIITSSNLLFVYSLLTHSAPAMLSPLLFIVSPKDSPTLCVFCPHNLEYSTWFMAYSSPSCHPLHCTFHYLSFHALYYLQLYYVVCY